MENEMSKAKIDGLPEDTLMSRRAISGDPRFAPGEQVAVIHGEYKDALATVIDAPGHRLTLPKVTGEQYRVLMPDGVVDAVHFAWLDLLTEPETARSGGPICHGLTDKQYEQLKKDGYYPHTIAVADLSPYVEYCYRTGAFDELFFPQHPTDYSLEGWNLSPTRARARQKGALCRAMADYERDHPAAPVVPEQAECPDPPFAADEDTPAFQVGDEVVLREDETPGVIDHESVTTPGYYRIKTQVGPHWRYASQIQHSTDLTFQIGDRVLVSAASFVAGLVDAPVVGRITSQHQGVENNQYLVMTETHGSMWRTGHDLLALQKDSNDE